MSAGPLAAEPRRPPELGTRPCPVCGGRSFDLDRRLTDNRTGIFTAPFELARCAACGVLAVASRPPAAELEQAYEVGYGPYPAGGPPPPSRIGALERVARRAWHALDGQATVYRVGFRSPVLDVGAGDGTAVALLRALGHEAVGLEPNRRAAASARARGIPVECGDLESHPFPAGGFRTVLMNQVIEHVPDPAASVAAARELLTADGRLVLMTPNPCGVPARLFGDEWAHWHAPYHLHLFGPRQLRRLLESGGFVIERLRTVTPTFWLRMSLAARRMRTQRTGASLGGRDWQPPWWIRLAVAPLVRPVDAAGGGDCLIAVAARGDGRPAA